MKRYIPLFAAAFMTTVIFMTIFTASQQVLRLDADDPQTQMSEDAARQLNAGVTPDTVVGATRVDIAQSLSPFMIIYDKSGREVAASGFLGNTAPIAPLGVLAASVSGTNKVTWQPRSTVRIASVTVSAKDYYVLSGRSLRQVEQNENTVGSVVLAGWSVAVITIVGGFVLLNRFKPTDR